jgi:hypothetical protein
MLKLMGRFAKRGWIASASRLLALSLAWGVGAAQAARAEWSTTFLPALAQAQKTAAPEAQAEGASWPILDWLIVSVLICAAVFVVCRSSRRN